MGRKAKIKAKRREERRLLEAHPERQCGFVHFAEGEHGEQIRKRCELAGRYAVELREGDRSIDGRTGEVRGDEGTAYACELHASMFRISGHKLRKIA